MISDVTRDLSLAGKISKEGPTSQQSEKN